MYRLNPLRVETINWIKFLTTLVLTALLVACASIPSQELQTYQNNFIIARSSVQDMILAAKVAAEKVAQHPDNPNGLNVRRKNLSDRAAALDARLAAVELIDEYNAALVSLASGTDPSAVQGNLNNLVDGLGSFDISALTDIAGKITPLAGVISQAISLIDDLIKQKKFEEAVTEAQKPITGIIAILREDADSIHEIEAQLMGLSQDTEFNQLTAQQKRFKILVNTYKSTNDVTKLVNKLNGSMKGLKTDDDELIKALQVKHTPGPKTPQPVELETMRALVDQINAHIQRFNGYTDQVVAHQTMIEEYKKVLIATSNAFVKLSTAVKTNQRAGTVKFLASVLSLRKAIIQYQETRQQ